MTNPTPHGQVPEALRLAHIFDNPLPPEWPDMVAAAAELRRQHARIAELEALGGVQPLSLQKATPAGVDQAQAAINLGASGGGQALSAARTPADSVTAAAAGAVAGPSDDDILNRTGTGYAPGTREYDLDLIRWYRERIATPPAQAADSVLEDAARALIEAIEYTPLGLRAIKAMNRLRAALAPPAEQQAAPKADDFYEAVNDMDGLYQAAPKAAPGEPSDALADLREGQWWVNELDALSSHPTGARIYVTADLKRAVAVVHNLLRSLSKLEAAPQPAPAPLSDDVSQKTWALLDELEKLRSASLDEEDWGALNRRDSELRAALVAQEDA